MSDSTKRNETQTVLLWRGLAGVTKSDGNARIEVDERVHLSRLAADDRQACVEHCNDPEIYRNTLRIPYPYGESDFDSLFASQEQLDRQHPCRVWAIRASSNQLIGCCGLSDFKPEHTAEIGYWLARPHWNQGIMSAVLPVWCEFAMQRWGLVRLTASVFEFNSASARVLEKSGFQLEGRLRKCSKKGEQFIDCLLYAKVVD